MYGIDYVQEKFNSPTGLTSSPPLPSPPFLSFVLVSVFLFFFFETGSGYVAQAGLENS
jgi:hypothetical protein